MNNAKIADIFDQVADLLEFKSANPFRVRAYRRGARTIRDLSESVASIVNDSTKKLTDIDGIGKDLAAKCETLISTGELPMLAELLSDIPGSVLDLLRVPGLGPKKAAAVFNQRLRNRVGFAAPGNLGDTLGHHLGLCVIVQRGPHKRLGEVGIGSNAY